MADIKYAFHLCNRDVISGAHEKNALVDAQHVYDGTNIRSDVQTYPVWRCDVSSIKAYGYLGENQTEEI